MYKIDPSMSTIEARRYQLLNRIEALEKINDQYIIANGEMRSTIRSRSYTMSTIL